MAENGLVGGVDFVTVVSEDLEVSRDFYAGKLGLENSVWIPERHFSEYETGNLTLSVVNAKGMGLEMEPSRNPIALHVDDVEAARAKLEAKGIEFHGDTLDTGVCHMAMFTDPHGNGLMLHHRYAPRG
jgi:predicted enzyme related to lactoylglutathione lyase